MPAEKQHVSPDSSNDKIEEVPKDPPPKDAKILEVTNADLALALSTGPPLKATSIASLKLFAILTVAFMGSVANGFDGQGTPLQYGKC